jgi:hypothetical protein
LCERDDIREPNTALGITTKVAEPKDEHGGEEGVLGRARCIDDLVTLRHPPIERLISTIYRKLAMTGRGGSVLRCLSSSASAQRQQNQ